MRKHKMIAKTCPVCHQQVPVACKNCHCGHSFYNCKRNARSVSPSLEILKLFVTQQRKREKPNFYDALIYDKQLKKEKALLKPVAKSSANPPPAVAGSSTSNDEDLEEKKENAKKKRIKAKEDQYEKILTSLSEEKSLQCKFILEELNRKVRLVSCQSFL